MLERLIWKDDGFFTRQGRRVKPEALEEPITVKIGNSPTRRDEEATNKLIQQEAERHSPEEAVAFSIGRTHSNPHTDCYAIQYFKCINTQQY